MITKALAFQTSDGQTHSGLGLAQQHEVEILANSKWTGQELPNVKDLSKWIVEHGDKLVDILTTKPTSKVRARKINGGTKKRAATATAAV